MSKERNTGNESESEIDDLNDKDVLMGRGKNISEWAGNIYFRQIVNQFRGEYNGAARDLKVAIALRVMQKIENIGGRFVRTVRGTAGDKYVKISRARAVEKCCQALREKEKSHPPIGNPFSGNKQPTHNPKKRVVRAKQSSPFPVAKPKSKVPPTQSRKIPLLDLVASETPSPKVGPQNAFPISANESPLERIQSQHATKMIERLSNFKRKYSHSGVPPGWPGDPDLADWCSMQRQRLRLVRCGHVPSSPDGESLIQKLNQIEFVWDYEEWHWEQQFTKLCSSITGKGENLKMDIQSAEWLLEQKRQYADSFTLPSLRLKRLRETGIPFP